MPESDERKVTAFEIAEHIHQNPPAYYRDKWSVTGWTYLVAVVLTAKEELERERGR